MTKSPPRLATSISTWPRTMSSKRDDALADAEAERRPAALGLARGALLGGQVRAAADVARRLLGGLLAPCGRRRAPRACSSRGRPCPRRGAARRPRRRAAAAASGGTGAYGPRAASPATSGPSSQCEPEPVQPVEDVLLVGDRAAGDVRVLEAEDERAAGVAREQVVEQRRPGGPDVERAGRARRDPDADWSSVRSSRSTRAGLRRHAGGRAPGRPRRAGRGRAPPAGGRASPGRAARRASASRATRERARIVIVRARRQRPRLEVRQQAGVLLGLLGDPVDRRLLRRPRSRSGGCPAGRRRAVSASIGLPCGQVSGWPSISSRRASTRGEMAPWRRIASSSDSAQPRPTTEVSSHSSSACRRKIAVRGRPPGRRQVELAALGVGDEAVGDEPPEHLAGGLGGDARCGGRPGPP